MSKVVGIIAEYNPFHNGHLYHIQETKRKTNADYIICVITGNFTQRGDVSIINKWKKAEIALLNGVDMVIELPLVYSISSAENFASGAIKILNELKVDMVSFGVETDSLEDLDKIASLLIEEPDEYKAFLKDNLEKGLSYPKARELAVGLYLNEPEKCAKILSSPNNILGIEYLKAIKNTKSEIKSCLIKRKYVNHNDLTINNNLASGAAIRKLLNESKMEDIKRLMPVSSFNILKDEFKKGFSSESIQNFEKEIIYNLRKMTVEEVREIAEVEEGLENKMKKAANISNNYLDFMNNIKSKRYTRYKVAEDFGLCFVRYYKARYD